jgi:hypothetical protein
MAPAQHKLGAVALLLSVFGVSSVLAVPAPQASEEVAPTGSNANACGAIASFTDAQKATAALREYPPERVFTALVLAS